MKDEQREITGLDLSAGGCTIHYAPRMEDHYPHIAEALKHAGKGEYTFPPANCVQCGKPVEETRRCYVVPTCYACLPPPEPLPVIPTREQLMRRIGELDLQYQAALADLAMLRQEHQRGQEHLATLEQRVEKYKDSHTLGRASAIFEAVTLLDEGLKWENGLSRRTVRWAIAQVRGIKP